MQLPSMSTHKLPKNVCLEKVL